jgi:hypothetical protein
VTVPVPNPFVIGPGNSSWQALGDGGCGERETAKKRKEEESAAEGEEGFIDVGGCQDAGVGRYPVLELTSLSLRSMSFYVGRLRLTCR